jgi:hypothetical protein
MAATLVQALWSPPTGFFSTPASSVALTFGASSSVTLVGNTGGLTGMTAGGTYTGPTQSAYQVYIFANGTPDTFVWAKDNGSFSSPIAITGAPQSLDDGVTITFASTTGNTVGDALGGNNWIISAQPVTTAVATGSLLVVGAYNGGSGNPVGAVFDSQGNSWFQAEIAQNFTLGNISELWYTFVTNPGATTVTATWPGGGNPPLMFLAEFAGVIPSPLGKHNAVVATLGQPGPMSVSLTGLRNNSLVFSMGELHGATLPMTITAGFTAALVEYVNLAVAVLQFSTGVGSSATITATSSGSSGSNWTICAAEFYTQPPGPPPCFPAWLVINEPGTMSPFIPNAWTDQSQRIFQQQSLRFSWLNGERGKAAVPLYIAAGDTYLPTPGSQVCIWDLTETDDYEVFSGKINDYEIKWAGLNGDKYVEMNCVSLNAILDTVRVPALLYVDQTALFILTDLFQLVTGSPLTLDPANQTGVTIAEFQITDFPTLAEVYTRLATLSQYIWGVNAQTSEVFFLPPTTTAAPFTVDSEDVLWEQMTLKPDLTDFRDRQIVKANASAAIVSSEYFVGTGQSTFDLLRPVDQIQFAWLTQNIQNSATGTFSGQPNPGDTITFEYATGSSTTWIPNNLYFSGSQIVDSNGVVWQTTQEGYSGTSSPPFSSFSNDLGKLLPDPSSLGPPFGGTVWKNIGAQGFGSNIAAIYTFCAELDNVTTWPLPYASPDSLPNNAQFGFVLIGPTVTETAQNTADAINSIQPSLGGTSGAGLTFSLATWENPLVNADEPAGASTIVVRDKAAGAGYITALSTTSSAFSWNNGTTFGGVTTGGTTQITVGIANQLVGAGPVFTIVYTPGSNVVTSGTPLQPGNNLQIQYLAVNSAYVQVENTYLVEQRAFIEGSTGQYQQVSTDDNALSLFQALQLAQQQLAAYGIIPSTFTFTTFKPGEAMQAMLTGQTITIDLVNPIDSNVSALINGVEWFIQEIQAEAIPIYGSNVEGLRFVQQGCGHFRYTVRCINVTQTDTWLGFWSRGLGSGSAAASSGGVAATAGGSLGSASGASSVGAQSGNMAGSPPTRGAGTVYQNTSSASIFVAVQASSTTAQDLQAFTDGNATPVQLVTAAAIAAGSDNAIGFWVVPLAYYEVTFATTPADGTILIWTEWS